MKRCSQCLEVKPLTEFHKHCHQVDGLNSTCKLCKNKADKAYRKANRSERINYDMKRRYGVDDQEYNTRLTEQNGGCGICGQACNTGKRLAIDHDHTTNKVRGLLCSRCNTALGMMNDDVERLFEAIIYLNEHAVNQ